MFHTFHWLCWTFTGKLEDLENQVFCDIMLGKRAKATPLSSFPHGFL